MPDSRPSDPLLKVERLVKRFPVHGSRDVVHAVNEISFSIDRGETLGLVGESGSGKTTVGRLIMGLIRPTSGTVMFRGSNMSQMRARELRGIRPRVQMVFQDPYEALNPRMRARDNILVPLRNAPERTKVQNAARISELAELVRLEPDLLDAHPHELSAGQQQRVGLARAMATEPDLIVLDEPVSNLDPTVRADIIDLLISVRKETGVSYLFISHDLTTVEYLSHRIAIMYLGELVELGSADSIFREQFHPYSRALLSSVLHPDPEHTSTRFPLTGEIPSPINLPKGCFLASRCPLVSEICVQTHPSLTELGEQRWAACHHSDLVPSYEGTSGDTADFLNANNRRLSSRNSPSSDNSPSGTIVA